MDNKVLNIILSAWKENFDQKEILKELGEEMFNLFTQYGLPPGIFKDKLNKSKLGEKLKMNTSKWIVIVNEYQNFFMDHQLKSGMTKENQKKMQEFNKKVILQLHEIGDFNIL